MSRQGDDRQVDIFSRLGEPFLLAVADCVVVSNPSISGIWQSIKTRA